jgi:glycosyltransferase involved in cell wall biosynthesis
MRILHFVDSAGLYGAEAVILELVRQQQRKGHSPAIVSIGAIGVDVKPLEREARRRGAPLYVVRMTNGPNVRGALGLLKLAQQENADILHSHGYKPDILLGLMPRRLRQQPLVCTLHGYTSAEGLDRMRVYRWLDMRAARRADAVVLVHDGMRSNAGLSALKNDTIRVIENGVADTDEGVSAALDPRIVEFCRGGRVIGSIGRLSPEKGFDRLISAFAQLVRDGAAERLLILGEGPERASLEQRVAALGLSDFVLMPGFVSAQRYLPLMKAFVLSSLTEGMPICLLEAMRAGVPIVATRVGGVPKMLGDGDGGVLVQPGDVNELARAIATLLKNEMLSRSVVRHSEITVRGFTSERMTERYLELYTSLLSARQRGPFKSVAAASVPAGIAR